MVADLEKSVADNEFLDVQSPQPFEESSEVSSGFHCLILCYIRVKYMFVICLRYI
jgi:hypothetical protein